MCLVLSRGFLGTVEPSLTVTPVQLPHYFDCGLTVVQTKLYSIILLQKTLIPVSLLVKPNPSSRGGGGGRGYPGGRGWEVQRRWDSKVSSGRIPSVLEDSKDSGGKQERREKIMQYFVTFCNRKKAESWRRQKWCYVTLFRIYISNVCKFSVMYVNNKSALKWCGSQYQGNGKWEVWTPSSFPPSSYL